MTASLPDEIKRVFETFITTEYTTVDRRGQPICWPLTPYYERGGQCIDVSHRARLPEEGQGRAPQPEGRDAVLRSDRLRDGERAAGARAGHGRAWTTRDLDANRERYLRESAAKLPETDEDGAAEGPPALLRLVLHAHLRARAAGAHLRLGRRRRDERAAAVRRAHGGGALRPRRGARRRARAGRGRRDGLGRAHGRARQPLPAGGAVARRPRRLPVLGAAADLGRPRRAPDPPGRRRPRAARAARARLPDGSRPSPATSCGSGTSRCAATWSRRTAAGR